MTYFCGVCTPEIVSMPNKFSKPLCATHKSLEKATKLAPCLETFKKLRARSYSQRLCTPENLAFCALRAGTKFYLRELAFTLQFFIPECLDLLKNVFENMSRLKNMSLGT